MLGVNDATEINRTLPSDAAPAPAKCEWAIKHWVNAEHLESVKMVADLT